MKYVSLFAGIGGFDLALNRLGHECVYANDFDKYCKITYDKNFKHKLDTTSIKDVSTTDIPDHDLLVGGFPCQSFSIAGKRRGFDDTRGTLFFDIARILKDKRPRHFILENVKGLLSHDEGKTFQTILGVLSDLGYEYQWQVLNSKNFGVPQNRERVFIVGHLRGEPRPKVFPIGENGGFFDKELQKPIQRKIPTNEQGGGQPNSDSEILETGKDRPLHQLIGGKQGMRVYATDKVSTTIASQAGGLGAKTGLYMTNMKIRRLTPLECERLQGFPDGWTEGVSDTQRYKQLGNAVTVNVVYEVAKRL